jgi:hypothetical protein
VVAHAVARLFVREMSPSLSVGSSADFGTSVSLRVRRAFIVAVRHFQGWREDSADNVNYSRSQRMSFRKTASHPMAHPLMGASASEQRRVPSLQH